MFLIYMYSGFGKQLDFDDCIIYMYIMHMDWLV